jgi:hypothetical protein
VIEIDGSMGEGGGQILRSSLALAADHRSAVPHHQHPRQPRPPRACGGST